MSVAAAPKSPLVQQVLAGRNRELQLLAADGVLPLGPEELIDVQVALAECGDEEIRGRARESISRADVLLLQRYLSADAPLNVVEYFARTSENPLLVERVLQRRDLPYEVAHQVAPRLHPAMQEILLLRQDLIVEHEDLLAALESNPELSAYSKRRIGEYRRHLLVREVVAVPVEEQDVEADAVSDEELQAAIEQIKATVAAEGEIDAKTGLSEGQVRQLPPPMRVKLARGASRTLRSILIKDTNSVVALSVLTASAITESEIEQVSNSRSVCEEVLTAVANNRDWCGKYAIMHNLTRNPRTPVAIALRLITRLSVRDLGSLSRDRNVSDAVRNTSGRLYQQKRA